MDAKASLTRMRSEISARFPVDSKDVLIKIIEVKSSRMTTKSWRNCFRAGQSLSATANAG
jgi:hypothetical protein